MRTGATPAVTLTLAALWCLAQAVDAPLLAAGVAVAAIGASAGTAVRRRSTRRLQVAVAALTALLGAGLAAVFAAPAGSPLGIGAQLAILIVLAPLAPLLYAASFGQSPGDGP
jgi:hypothetical protein